MNTYSYKGEDFEAVFTADKWKIGILRYSERFSRLGCFERHMKTPEVFVLLSGEAILYIKDDNGNISKTSMERNVVYEVPEKEWHHIVVSKDACVLIVENSDTSKENTEKVMIDL